MTLLPRSVPMNGTWARKAATLALAASMIFSAAQTAQAAMNGPAGASPAWTIRDVTLTTRAGISGVYDAHVAQGARIWVLECRGIWCKISSGNNSGWTHLSSLSFGQFPRGPFSGPKFSQ